MEARASPYAHAPVFLLLKTATIKMKIKKLLPTLAVLLLAACDSGTPVAPETAPGPIPAGTVAVVLQTTSAPEKRTVLENSENVQHVAYMHLYVFAGTSDDAVCVASENVGWSQPAGGNAKQYYLLRTPLPQLPDGENQYTFLAVGLDNTEAEITGTDTPTEGSAFAYDLPGTIRTASADGQTVATTLGEAKASLASGRSAGDMARAELFSGSSQIAPQDLKSPVGIELRRKVAGVALFIINIREEVETLEVTLHTNQNTEADLRTGKDTPIASATADDSRALITISKEAFLAGGVTTGGAYLLPLAAPTDAATATLILRLLDAGGSEIATRTIQENRDGTPVLNFALEANHYYGIGSMDNPVDLNDGKNTADIIVHPDWEAVYGEGEDDAITAQPESPKP